MIADKVTLGQKYGPAMDIKDQAEADAYLKECVDHNVRLTGNSRPEAEAIEKQNLGYFAGYYDNETRERVERLFSCRHPVFGSIAENGPPTAEEALRAGMEMGERLRKEEDKRR